MFRSRSCSHDLYSKRGYTATLVIAAPNVRLKVQQWRRGESVFAPSPIIHTVVFRDCVGINGALVEKTMEVCFACLIKQQRQKTKEGTHDHAGRWMEPPVVDGKLVGSVVKR